MNSGAAHQQIRSALRAELKRHHGQIGQIEADLSRSEGYLSRFCRGDLEITLKGCLETLEALEVDPRSFFSTALGAVTTSEDIILGLEGKGPFDRLLTTFEQAAHDIETSEDSEGVRRRHEVCVASLCRQPPDVQLRRLRTGKKYRCEEFVDQYLEHLERSRLDDPKSAVRLVVGLGSWVVPELPAEIGVRIEWLCRCLETYGSCARSLSDSRSAARAIRLGLLLSRRHGRASARASLLRRAAFVASDFGEFEKGLFLLREAQEIAYDEGDARNLGFIAISKGMLNNFSGNPKRAERGYQRGLETLEGLEDDEARRWRVTAYSGLVHLFTKQGKVDDAIHWMSRATQAFRDEGGLILGKLLWQQGLLERTLGRAADAISTLRAARKLLASGHEIDFALISIELASLLLDVGRRSEAVEVSKGLAALTEHLEDNKLAQGALLEFLRIVLAGRLDRSQLQSLKQSIEAGRSVRNAPLLVR